MPTLQGRGRAQGTMVSGPAMAGRSPYRRPSQQNDLPLYPTTTDINNPFHDSAARFQTSPIDEGDDFANRATLITDESTMTISHPVSFPSMPQTTLPLSVMPVKHTTQMQTSELPATPELPSLLISRAGKLQWELLPGSYKVPPPTIGDTAMVLATQNGEYRWIPIDNAIPDMPFEPAMPRAECFLGFQAWTYDPVYAIEHSMPQTGYTHLMKLPGGNRVEKVALYITQGSSGLVGINCAALYRGDGKRVAQTMEQNAHWSTAGAKWMSLDTSVSLGQEGGWLGFTVQGSPMPSFQCATSSPVHSFGMSGKDLRFAKVPGYPEQLDFTQLVPGVAWWGGIA